MDEVLTAADLLVTLAGFYVLWKLGHCNFGYSGFLIRLDQGIVRVASDIEPQQQKLVKQKNLFPDYFDVVA